MSSLPLGLNQTVIQRSLTTSSTAIFVPFTTQELFQSSGEALYYGLNALSNNLIMVDRKRLKNPNGLILGTPGSGKSFSAKREITNIFLITTDDIIICDPEAEYYPLVQKLGGQVIRISPVSTDYINPLDINTNYSEEENPLTLKSDFILSMCELIVGGKDGLQPVEKTIIDRSVRMVYQEFLADPKPEKMPILEDLYNILRNQKEPEAQRIATALEIYVHGSLNVFNHRTNVDVNNRFVCYDIRELGKHAAEVGIEVSLEMYEDTYIGTADGAVKFVNDVDVPAVGINADIGNLVRLHRPVEHWASMIDKLVPYARYWHVKNYMRIEDPEKDLIISYPTSLALGIINYREAIRKAIACGFNSAFLCEHYGGDGLSVCAMNRDYLRSILPR